MGGGILYVEVEEFWLIPLLLNRRLVFFPLWIGSFLGADFRAGTNDF